MLIRTITHKHANIYLIGGGGQFILFDCGWQDSFRTIRSALKDHGVALTQIRGVSVSHFHPDHAGTMEILRRHNIEPLILERQTLHIAWLNDFFAQRKNDPNADYLPLNPQTVTLLSRDKVQQLLIGWGIDGRILYTPGHSDDSISLIVGDTAFIGDLPPYDVADHYKSPEVAASWKELIASGAKRVYPAHGETYQIGDISGV